MRPHRFSLYAAHLDNSGSVFVGLSYYLLRISVELLRHGDVEQGVLLFGFEAIIATGVAYGLLIGLYVFLS